VAVQVNLPGRRIEKLQLTSVDAGPAEGFQTLLIGMRNQGNRLLKGTGSLVVSDESGERLKRGTFNVDTFVPQTGVAYPFVVPGEALPAGRYRAVVTVRYGQGRIVRLATWFTISDEEVEQVFGSDPQGPAAGDSSSMLWLLLAALAALLLGLAAWALLRRRGDHTPISPIYITAVHMPDGSGHEQIEFVQWQNPRTLETGQSTREEIVEWINSGGDLRVRDHAGDLRAGVVAADPPYIRTHAGGVWTDNLLVVPRY
jgi:LPXTG-motif cell wall-anchored protein